jgi:WD40 repeat protein
MKTVTHTHHHINCSLSRLRSLLPLLLSAGQVFVQPCTGAPFQFKETGSLITGRREHTATLLSNGKVLVAGGYNSTSGALASAEVYDPASGTWSSTGSLVSARWTHTATLLRNGKVLVAGGSGVNGVLLTSAELYDPATGTWTTTGSLVVGRSYQTATLLPSGKVLVVGGYDSTSFTGSGTLRSGERHLDTHCQPHH